MQTLLFSASLIAFGFYAYKFLTVHIKPYWQQKGFQSEGEYMYFINQIESFKRMASEAKTQQQVLELQRKFDYRLLEYATRKNRYISKQISEVCKLIINAKKIVSQQQQYTHDTIILSNGNRIQISVN